MIFQYLYGFIRAFVFLWQLHVAACGTVAVRGWYLCLIPWAKIV